MDVDNANMIRKNLRLNNLLNVSIHEVALGDRIGSVEYFRCGSFRNTLEVNSEARDQYSSVNAPVPSNELLSEMPHVHNAFIAGYWGYLELEKLAGYAPSTSIESKRDSLLDRRVKTFSKDAPDSYFQGYTKVYCRNYNSSRNFIFMVPEPVDRPS
jgi:hypothetical protein